MTPSGNITEQSTSLTRKTYTIRYGHGGTVLTATTKPVTYNTVVSYTVEEQPEGTVIERTVEKNGWAPIRFTITTVDTGE